ncbi:MAG: hypothetical protein IT576_21500 [Verrucomicrobiales bacterium]|nr:hypothetical protein [Verrucomicrobiales bacterium]
MNRFWQIMMMSGGLWAAFFGWREYRISQLARPEAADVSLLELENLEVGGVNQLVENAHVRFGPCLALYPATVYSFRVNGVFGTGESGPNTAVKDAFVPILPLDHPLVKALQNPDSPEARRGMTLNDIKFHVLLKTSQIELVRDIPRENRQLSQVQGVIINDIRPLKAEEEELLQVNFRRLKPEQVIIVEEGRVPWGARSIWALLGLGGGLFLVGGWLFFSL